MQSRGVYFQKSTQLLYRLKLHFYRQKIMNHIHSYRQFRHRLDFDSGFCFISLFGFHRNFILHSFAHSLELQLDHADTISSKNMVSQMYTQGCF